MSDTYVECLVKAKSSMALKALKFILIVITVLCALTLFVLRIAIALIPGIIAGVGIYFVGLNCDVEYEYLYLDKELTVDKIMNQSKRKKVGTYTLERIEILAPIHSYQLDNFKNRQVKVKDFSIGEELQPDQRYAMYYEGGEKIVLSPSEELIKVMRNNAPRKIFDN